MQHMSSQAFIKNVQTSGYQGKSMASQTMKYFSFVFVGPNLTYLLVYL
jgi:hypothetical protein